MNLEGVKRTSSNCVLVSFYFFAIKMQNTQNVVTIYKAPVYIVLVKAEKAYQGQTT